MGQQEILNELLKLDVNTWITTKKLVEILNCNGSSISSSLKRMRDRQGIIETKVTNNCLYEHRLNEKGWKLYGTE